MEEIYCRETGAGPWYSSQKDRSIAALSLACNSNYRGVELRSGRGNTRSDGRSSETPSGRGGGGSKKRDMSVDTRIPGFAAMSASSRTGTNTGAIRKTSPSPGKFLRYPFHTFFSSNYI